jgi:hypothetical protein
MRLPFTARPVVQRVAHLVDDEARHLAVDLARQLDHAGAVVQRLHLPGEVVRVERDAVPADAGSGHELHVAERLGRGGLDDLEDVDAEPVADLRHLVDQGDVHGPERVLEQLRQFGGLRGGDGHDGLHHAA